MLRTFAMLLTFLQLLGCDGTTMGMDAGADAMIGDPSVELGAGVSAFETLPESGGELELVGGPQGGFHVFVSARFSGLDPEGLILRFDATDVTTGSNVGTPAEFRLVRSRVVPDGAGFVRAGDFLILHDSDPDPVRGLTLDITVVAEEADTGRSASDHRMILVVDDVSG